MTSEQSDLVLLGLEGSFRFLVAGGKYRVEFRVFILLEWTT